MILALDLGTRMGFAHTTLDGIATGYVDFSSKRMGGRELKFYRFRQWLESLPIPVIVYFEEVRRHAGTTAAHVYGGFKAILDAYCVENGIPFQGIPVGEIKKFATGKGNAKKEAMVEAARKAGIDTTDDNEADAFWILKCAIEVYENGNN